MTANVNMTARRDNLEFLFGLLKKESGLTLSDNKDYLLRTRLEPVVIAHGYHSLDQLIDGLRTAPNSALKKEIIESLATHESFFFRDKKPFDYLKATVIPALLEKNKGIQKIRIWSAACSSGQEPYSLAMLIAEMGAKLQGWTIEIVATDMSEAILAKAAQGQYSQFEVQRGMPIQYLMKYFKQEGQNWLVTDKIKNMLQFKKHNILHSAQSLGRFDVVFCRNVLIYFENEVKKQALQHIAQVMNPGGTLVLGASEMLFQITDAFENIKEYSGIYILR
jgi:chemotaxis protein methyltransferase CheR